MPDEPRPAEDAPAPVDQPADPETTLAAGRRRHGERLPALFFVASILGGIALAVVYALGGQTQFEGAFLAVALCGFGGGLVLWAKRFMPAGPEIEERGELASSDEDVAAFKEDFDVGEYQLERRSLLTKLMIGAGAALGLAAIFPIQSLGPRPGPWMTRSPFQRGHTTGRRRRSAGRTRPAQGERDPDGLPRRPARRRVRGNRVDPLRPVERLHPAPRVARTGRSTTSWPTPRCARTPVVRWACTRRRTEPCSARVTSRPSTCYDGARPVFGPAAVSLPQLPLGLDADGNLMSTGPFSGPVGPEFWDQNLLWEDGS